MSKLDSLEPGFKELVETVIAETETATGLDWLCTSGRRSIGEQNRLYEQGRTTPGNIVTRAKGGQSPHNFGLAADLAPYKNSSIWWDAPAGYWAAMGAIAESHGLVWGGNFKNIVDQPHIEAADWRTTRDAWLKGEIKVE